MKNIGLLLKQNWFRIAYNVVGWYIVISSTVYNCLYYTLPSDRSPAAYYLHAALFNLFFVTMTFIHTLWLMPRFLFKQQYKQYLLGVGATLLVLSMLQGIHGSYLLGHYPGLDFFNITSVDFEMHLDSGFLDTYFVLLPSMVFFILISGTMRSLYHLYEVNRNNEKIRQQQSEMELQLLKSQLNPHFLFNVLNSIYALTLKKSDMAPEIVLKLSDILRYLLYDSNQREMPLQKELQILEDYIAIERIRMNPLHQIAISADIDARAYHIAPGMLITIVENAVKHGLDSMADGGYIEVMVKGRDGVLSFSCTNNYKNKLIKPAAGGIGLANIRKRLALLYPGKHSLEIKNENQLFTLFLSVNLNS